MTSSPHSFRRASLALGAAFGLIAASTAFAAGPAAPADAQARYKKEVEVCNTGKSNQDRATCLREATNALAEAKRARLDNGQSSAELRANAMARCDLQPAADREACRARAKEDGIVSGTPQAGGVLREHVEVQTIVPARPAGQN